VIPSTKTENYLTNI